VKTLHHYLCGRWVRGDGDGVELIDPTHEATIAVAYASGLPLTEAYAHARIGGAALRALTFAQRGELLAGLSHAIHAVREELIDLSIENAGSTRSDAKFDVDGATATLSYYATLAAHIEGRHLWHLDAPQKLGRSPRYVGRHIAVPRPGVALLIGAYNFPCWGFAEKAACALLAGMPVISKAATATALVAERMARAVVDAGCLPAGAVSFLFARPDAMLAPLGSGDCVAFTGSSATAAALRAQVSVPVNVEADSLNCAILGPQCSAETFDLFVREVVRDMTQKAGQKCTAIRRVLVPPHRMQEVRDTLCEALSALAIGDPRDRDVKMGPLATAEQWLEVRGAIAESGAEVCCGGDRPSDLTRGYFVAPTLLLHERPARSAEREIFGPVAWLVPCDDPAPVLAQGEGALVASLYSDDEAYVRRLLPRLAPYVGRLHLGSARVAEHSPSPGTVLPMMHHGGPGKAGSGTELGGLRGLRFYMNELAVQGFSPWLEDLEASAPQ
jgi:oxepin-CoA hydrolase/3-oxo-5,6-dehydrosuberyl-CoA semialdehyde dehydrogenase